MPRNSPPPPEPVQPVDGVAYSVRAYWDEGDRVWTDDEVYVDTEIEARATLQYKARILLARGKGETFIEIGIWKRKWSRGGDGVLRWHGSKEQIAMEDVPAPGPPG